MKKRSVIGMVMVCVMMLTGCGESTIQHAKPECVVVIDSLENLGGEF